jgi:hypothetical protein
MVKFTKAVGGSGVMVVGTQSGCFRVGFECNNIFVQTITYCLGPELVTLNTPTVNGRMKINLTTLS